jgi:hypothetical protein
MRDKQVTGRERAVDATAVGAKASSRGIGVWEGCVYWLAAAGAYGLVEYVYRFRPVDYVRFISEDHFGEYASSMAWLVGSLLMVGLALWRGRGVRRWVWLVVGLGLFAVGMEEISWGQRIFGIETPQWLEQVNDQGEITFHNTIETVYLHAKTGAVIGLWALGSLVAGWRLPRVKGWLERWGLPVVDGGSLPVFALVVIYFVTGPVIKADEVGEFFLGVAMAVFAVQLFLRHGFGGRLSAAHRMAGVALVLVVIGASGATLAARYPRWLGWRLNRAAAEMYPGRGMYEQAEMIYQYIEAHPKDYVLPSTRFGRVRILQGAGQMEAARLLALRVAEEERGALQEATVGDESYGEHARRLATALQLAGEEEQARATFEAAMSSDEQRLAAATWGDEQAGALWSIARTLAARGEDREVVKEKAEEAMAAAESEGLHQAIVEWIHDIGREVKEE